MQLAATHRPVNIASFSFFYFYFMYCLRISVCLHACSAHRGRKMASDPPGLESQSIVSCYMGAVTQTQVLRAVRDLNHCALSPALSHYFRAPSPEVTAD